jgi:hypothetical protein
LRALPAYSAVFLPGSCPGTEDKTFSFLAEGVTIHFIENEKE